MNYFGLSDKGRYRAENQDSFELGAVRDGVLGVLCDGMGGEAHGLTASDLAAGRFFAFARAALEALDGEDTADVLCQAVDAANRKVYRFACQSEEYSGMGTTLVAGYWRGDTAVFVNVGDSRAYRIAKDGIVQITKDHSRVQEMIDSGQITQAQARFHPAQKYITRAVGSERFVRSDAFIVPIREGDSFLLCSDGLTKALEDAELHRVLLAADSPEEACQTLIREAIEHEARDNVTVIVINSKKGGA